MKVERPILEALASLLEGEAAIPREEHGDHEPDLEELSLQARVEVDAGTELEKYGRWLKPGEEYAKDVGSMCLT